MTSTSDKQLPIEHWDSVQSHRLIVADELDRMAKDLPNDTRKYVASVSRWFRGPADLERALERPDVLAICIPLLQLAQRGPIRDADIPAAIRQGFCHSGKTVSSTRRLVRLMIYPILIGLASSLVAIGFSFWILPEFDTLYEEFGIELPRMTLLTLHGGKMIREWWWILLALPVTLLFLYAALTRTNSILRPANMSWLDQQLMSTRNAFAHWAWHLSLLLEAGIPSTKSFHAAGSATGNRLVRKISTEAQDTDLEVHESVVPVIGHPQYSLLERVIRMEPSPGKITLLRQVANYYWDRNQSVGEWWIHWLVGLILAFVGFSIVVCVLSLFLPLFAIVSGLTG